MKISLIGASGFLGSNLIKTLKQKEYELDLFDIKPSDKINYLDLRDNNSLLGLNKCDVLINLAAEHADNVSPKSLYYEVNVKGAKNICQAAEKLDIQKIIFSSSVAIYGFAPPNTDESGKVNYFNEYGRTKYLAEKIYMEWFEKDPENRTLVIIRPTVIFGPGNRGNVYNLINQIASKKFLMFGSGKNIKSMAFVDNVSAFFEYSLKFKTGLHIFNYVDKPDLNMNEFVKIIRNKLFGKNNVGLRLPSFIAYLLGFFADVVSFLTGRKLTASLIRIRKFLSQTSFETSIGKLDFKPPYSLKDALHLTLETEFISKK